VEGRSFIVVPIALKNFLSSTMLEYSFSLIARKIVGQKSCEGMQEKIYLIQNKIYYVSFYSRKTKLLAFS
jgi:hypothetical protein